MPPMKYRKLRIAWSVAWGIACLLLIVFWVRSYWRLDRLHYQYSSSHCIRAALNQGFVCFKMDECAFPLNDWKWEVWKDFLPIDDLIQWFMSSQWFIVPFAFPAILLSCVATAPWLPIRFSLRTLLIAMTMVAVGLGLAVYSLRN